MPRRVFALLVVLGCALALGLSAQGIAKPAEPSAPDFRMKGPAQARAVIVEYSDFQCPACRVAEPAIEQILALYGADTRFVFKHFPLEGMHHYARAAAIAAECAGKQGKFWEYHDALYKRQQEWSNETAEEHLQKYAKELKLDSAAWGACRADPASARAIDADKTEGEQRWVGSTPTFFVNGRRFVGAKQLAERGSRAVEKAVKR